MNYPVQSAMQRRRNVYVVKTESGEGLACGPVDPEKYVLGPFADTDDAEAILRERRALQAANEWLVVGLLVTGLVCLVIMMPGGW